MQVPAPPPPDMALKEVLTVLQALDSEAIWARWIVWVAAAAAAVLILVRHRLVDAAAPPAYRTAA